jgi:hypothetical protein
MPFVLALALATFATSQESRPTSVGALYRPGETAVWRIEQDGKSLGYCSSTYVGPTTLGALRAHVFRGQAELEAATHGGVLVQRFTLDHWTDEEGLPLRFDFRAEVGPQRSGVSGTFAGGEAELELRQGAKPQALRVQAPAEAFLLANNMVGGLELLVALAAPESGEARFTLFSANVLKTFPYTLKAAGNAPDGARVFDDSLGERLHVDAAGKLTRVEVAAAGLAFRRDDEGIEPFAIDLPSYRVPDDLYAEEVRIEDGEVVLAGTLTRPKESTGKLPGVFFLSGSGLQDRDGFAQGFDLGTHEILDRVARAGCVVLRVDDRGVGGSSGPLDALTFDDLVADGRRALRFLRARPEVDPARVALLGHSEGGMSGPILAAETSDPPLAALVLLAAPGRPLEVLLKEQLLLGRELSGESAEARAVFAREIDAFLARVAKGEPLEAAGLAPGLAAFVPSRTWLASHLGRDPLPALAAVRCPILILQGAKDQQVLAEHDAPRLVQALTDAGHRAHELRVFPELDHLFKRVGASPLDALKPRPVDPELLDALATWLAARLGA